MRCVFVHQNMPGQFAHLARALAAQPGNEVVYITQRADRPMHGVGTVTYKPARTPHDNTHLYLRRLEEGVLNGQQVARALAVLRQGGFVPDVVVGHPGWGETLFVKDILPETPLLSYCEYYFGAEEFDHQQGRMRPSQGDEALVRRMENAQLLLGLDAMDLGWSPTEWQKARHPARYWPDIEVAFEGVDVEEARPDPAARFAVPGGGELSAGDEVITFAARGLEPLRGFPRFMRALPEVLARRPSAQVLIAGDAGAHYGRPPAPGLTWRELLERELALDPARVHFTGWLARPDYLRLLQVSSLHVHLALPFTASWSLAEAMAAGCLVLASDTGPIRELVAPGLDALLSTAEEPAALAQEIVSALGHPDAAAIRGAARRSAESRLSLAVCLPGQRALLERLLAR